VLRARWRLAAAAGGTWLVTLLGLSHEYVPVLILVGIGVALTIVRQLRGTIPQSIWAIVGLTAVAALSILAHQPLRYPEPLTNHQGDTVTLTAVTGATLTHQSRHVRASIVRVGDQRVFGAAAMVFLEPPEGRLPPGTRIDITGEVVKNGRYDSRAWLIFAEEWDIVGAAPELVAAADRMRATFLGHALSRGGDGGALLPGLSLGDTQAVSQSLTHAMRVSSLSHLVAVSGANCALVVGIAILITTMLGGGLWWRVGVGLVTLAGFVLLVSPEPSVIHAAVMASITLVAIATGRPHGGLHALSLTTWLLLLQDPWRAVDIALILSVAATAGIVLGLVPVGKFLARFLPAWLALPIALPLVAQLAVLPFLVLLTPVLPTYGVVANLLAAPFVPLVTLSGLLGAVAGSFAPSLGSFFAAVGWYPASAIAAIARSVSIAPLRDVEWLPGVWGFVSAATLSAGLWWAMVSTRPLYGAMVAAITVTLIFLTAELPRVVSALAKPSQWQIAQCDVGQGDAVVINTEAGAVLLDTGDDERKLRECLKLLGVSRLRYLVLTHFDIDHMGQAPILAGRVDTVLSGPPDNDLDRALLRELNDAGATVLEVARGDSAKLGDYTLEVLWPLSSPIGKPGNDSSVVILLVPHAEDTLSFLGLGDLGERAQLMLMPRLADRKVDVVKVSHHGSRDQLPALYRQLDADVGLIGVGSDNRYDHPTEQTLQMLQSVGTMPIRSDERGTITLHRSEQGIELWSVRDG
jgi:competence protein ComEC